MVEHAERRLGRAALDTYGVPYTYFGDIKLREGNLRQMRRHHLSARRRQRAVAGRGDSEDGFDAAAVQKTAETPNLGVQDQADDIRGGMGWEGLMELVKFVREGGTLITEGSTSTIFPDYKITPGVTVETPEGLFVRGSVMRGVVADRRSPIAWVRRAGAGGMASARTRCSTPAVAAFGDSAAGEAVSRCLASG